MIRKYKFKKLVNLTLIWQTQYTSIYIVFVWMKVKHILQKHIY